MKKFLLGAFILLDIGLVAASVFVMTTYIRRTRPLLKPTMAISVSSTPFVPALPVASSSPTALGNSELISADATGATTRKIRFSYHNPRAKRVAIRADFTGWKADPMIRGSNGEWSYTVPLTPGEYAYCFSVDDKPPLKDPANKRTKLIGRAVVSAIVVKALAPPK